MASAAVCENFRDLMEKRARENPSKVFAVSGDSGTEQTYGGLLADSRKLAWLLKERDLGPGGRAAMMLPGGWPGVTVFLGIMAAGFTAVPLGLSASAEQLAYVLKNSGSALVFADPKFTEILREAASLTGRSLAIEEVPESGPMPWSHFDSRPDWPEATSPEPEREALVIYTSGTTGRPKGARLCHRGLLIGAENVAASHDLGPDDRVLAALPFNHINALNVAILAPFCSGGSLVLQKAHDPWNYWSTAAAYGCTWLNAVPTIIAMILMAPDPGPETDLSRVRFCRSASAPLSPEHHHEFEERFGIGIVETMGMTEMSGTVLTNPMKGRKIGSAGRALKVENRIVDVQTGQTLDHDEEGEIQFRGPNLMLGYLDDAEATAKVLTEDGWLRSGDLGRRDADGFYFITGRLKEIIIKGGENIAPRAVDEVLLRHPAVLSAAAFGVPDKVYGQEVEAAVILKPGAEAKARELRDFCRKYLSTAEVPRRIHFVAEIPAGSSGKIQRLKLLDLLYK
ncbi:long-chain fatty acid--CoA ligase (plasmid) [Deltaproteobacteria bacterium Smac51]|nr:long-chain fatty acid--CoA ligase [Deltaproteobacteria bacterium Smac51]